MIDRCGGRRYLKVFLEPGELRAKRRRAGLKHQPVAATDPEAKLEGHDNAVAQRIGSERQTSGDQALLSSSVPFIIIPWQTKVKHFVALHEEFMQSGPMEWVRRSILRSDRRADRGRSARPVTRGTAGSLGSSPRIAVSALVRPYRDRDLAALLQLWARGGQEWGGADLLTVDDGADLLQVDGAICVVADDGDALVGLALGIATGGTGWILRVVVARDVPESDPTPRLLDELEARLAEAGTRKLIALVEQDDAIHARLSERGYAEEASVLCMQRLVPTDLASPSALGELGGRMVEPGLWGSLKGLKDAKEIIERRVILPIAEPRLAARHAISSPSAVVLFGPPGTGKTTFAKGIASRVSWPFVEIQPSQLAAEGPERQAELLAHTFTRIFDLPSAVVFVDEVEDLASKRDEDRRVNVSVTNEFLKQIPRFREVPHHLLACATNWISRLDSAFLRPGRFDWVLPVGPPDAEARASIWLRYVEEITDEEVDIEALVGATEFFTPADIEFAARKAAQRAFEREHFQGAGKRALMEDFLDAIRETRPTLSATLVEEFNADTESFARY